MVSNLKRIRTPTPAERAEVLRKDLAKIREGQEWFANFLAEHGMTERAAETRKNLDAVTDVTEHLARLIEIGGPKCIMEASEHAQRGVETEEDRQILDRLYDFDEKYPDEDFPELED